MDGDGDMKPWYAINARNLLDVRRQGVKPQGPVVVSLVGGDFAETVLYVKPDMPVDAMDWRMLVNLDVWVWGGVGAAIERIVATAWRVAQSRPAQLHVRFEHKQAMHEVECGTGWHQGGANGWPSDHGFLWWPLNVGGSVVGRRLCTALSAKGERVVL